MVVKSTQGFILYRYDPSIPAAILFAALFLISAAIHTWQMIKHKTYYFLPLIVAAYVEGIGYLIRIPASHSPTQLAVFIVSEVMVLVSPALMAASIYIILGRIIRFVAAEKHAIVPVHLITKFFVWGDVVTFLLQMAGGGMLSMPKFADAGQKIVMFGLCAQIVWFGFFVVVSSIFHRRVQAMPTPKSQATLQPPGRPGRFSWLTLLKGLYVASAFIMIRSIFRLAEYIEGRQGYLQTHEAFYYCLDALMMIQVVYIFNVVHPALVMPQSSMTIEDTEAVIAIEPSNVETMVMAKTGITTKEQTR